MYCEGSNLQVRLSRLSLKKGTAPSQLNVLITCTASVDRSSRQKPVNFRSNSLLTSIPQQQPFPFPIQELRDQQSFTKDVFSLQAINTVTAGTLLKPFLSI